MKCDHCDSEAIIHDMTIRNKQPVERHWCEACAVAQGIELRPAPKHGDLIQALATGPGQTTLGRPAASPREAGRCGGCGTTFAEFRQSGLMGCADCYRAFEARLGPLLERAHEGASHHVGKVPRRALAASRSGPASLLADAKGRAEKAAILNKQLDDAVAAEQYERAAKIRDELRRLDQSAATQEEIA